MAQPGTYRLKNNRGCLRISEEGGFVFLLPECAADDPIFSVIRDTATHFTMRGRVVEGQSYCSTGGKNVPVGAPRLDYAACKVIDTLPAGATKKPSIPTQQFRVEEIGSRPGWYQIVSDAYGKSRCWDVANPEMSDVYLKPCTNIAAQQFQLLPATR
ncbi:MAG: hypothetical protein JHD35_11265 [Sphingopyxis sp.]|nr:hypothetical protein [Sphingopyxis sp.]